MKIAICFAELSANPVELSSNMAKSMCLLPSHSTEVFPVEYGAISMVKTSERFSAVSMARKNSNGNLLLVSGVPIDLHGSLDERLNRAVNGSVKVVANELKKLDGAFAAIFWDAADHKLLIFTDPLGIQPLYMAIRQDMFLLATELKAFPASNLIDVDMDMAGWGGFVSLGFNTSNHTNLADVERVPAATKMVYNPQNAKLESSTYWEIPKFKQDMQIEDVDIPKMLWIVQKEIESYISHCRSGTILMSGGFDSRLILGLLHKIGADYKALILKHLNSSAEARFANKIAKKLNCQGIKQIVPSWEFYSSPSYLKYLVMNEGAIPSMRLYITPYLSNNIKPEMHAVWEGVGPGFAFAPAFPISGGFFTYIQDRCKDKESLSWQAAFSVFSDSVGKGMYEAFQESLARDIQKYGDNTLGVARFQMANQMRRFLAIAPMAVYSNSVLPFTPGLSKDLWDHAGRIPLHVSSEKKLYLRLFKDHLKEAISVPICTGGNLVSQNGSTSALFMQEKFDLLRFKSKYYLQRLTNTPTLRNTFSKFGWEVQTESERNLLLDNVVKSVQADHPDLRPDVIHRLQKATPPYDWSTRLERRMLFYWQTWRWVMEGKLNSSNAEKLFHEEMIPDSCRIDHETQF